MLICGGEGLEVGTVFDRKVKSNFETVDGGRDFVPWTILLFKGRNIFALRELHNYWTPISPSSLLLLYLLVFFFKLVVATMA